MFKKFLYELQTGQWFVMDGYLLMVIQQETLEAKCIDKNWKLHLIDRKTIVELYVKRSEIPNGKVD